MITDSAYSFGDQLLNADAGERTVLVKQHPLAVSLLLKGFQGVELEYTQSGPPLKSYFIRYMSWLHHDMLFAVCGVVLLHHWES